MPETDVTKMKVADLKRELKIRGLTTTGNKTELQDRLQTALIDSELSLEDTAISGEELLDESVLTDEEEAKILEVDENELLTSSSIEISSPLDPHDRPSASKKVVLKRRSSFNSLSASIETASSATSVTNENAAPTLPAKALKLGENQIVVSSGDTAADTNAATPNKIKELTMKERLELRAKKFGTAENVVAGSDLPAAKTGGPVNDEKQIELLKKRAERFGCVVSPHIAKIDAVEKLKKRQERFGIATSSASDSTTTTTSAATSKGNDAWAEKARMRLERFKGTAKNPTT